MEQENKPNGFQYTYSANEQEELKRIRDKYMPATEQESKMERLRRLDAGVTRKAQILSLAVGIIGVLLLGFGMSLFMSDFGEILGAYRSHAMAIGILCGIIGGMLAGLAYPLHQFVMKHERKKYASEILRLTDELMK